MPHTPPFVYAPNTAKLASEVQAAVTHASATLGGAEMRAALMGAAAAAGGGGAAAGGGASSLSSPHHGQGGSDASGGGVACGGTVRRPRVLRAVQSTPGRTFVALVAAGGLSAGLGTPPPASGPRDAHRDNSNDTDYGDDKDKGKNDDHGDGTAPAGSRQPRHASGRVFVFPPDHPHAHAVVVTSTTAASLDDTALGSSAARLGDPGAEMAAAADDAVDAELHAAASEAMLRLHPRLLRILNNSSSSSSSSSSPSSSPSASASSSSSSSGGSGDLVLPTLTLEQPQPLTIVRTHRRVLASCTLVALRLGRLLQAPAMEAPVLRGVLLIMQHVCAESLAPAVLLQVLFAVALRCSSLFSAANAGAGGGAGGGAAAEAEQSPAAHALWGGDATPSSADVTSGPGGSNSGADRPSGKDSDIGGAAAAAAADTTAAAPVVGRSIIRPLRVRKHVSLRSLCSAHSASSRSLLAAAAAQPSIAPAHAQPEVASSGPVIGSPQQLQQQQQQQQQGAGSASAACASPPHPGSPVGFTAKPGAGAGSAGSAGAGAGDGAAPFSGETGLRGAGTGDGLRGEVGVGRVERRGDGTCVCVWVGGCWMCGCWMWCFTFVVPSHSSP